MWMKTHEINKVLGLLSSESGDYIVKEFILLVVLVNESVWLYHEWSVVN